MINSNFFLGSAIEQICEETNEEVTLDRTLLVRAAKCLLAAITRVLLLADIVVVKQLLLAKDKVIPSNLMARSLLPNLLEDPKGIIVQRVNYSGNNFPKR